MEFIDNYYISQLLLCNVMEKDIMSLLRECIIKQILHGLSLNIKIYIKTQSGVEYYLNEGE